MRLISFKSKIATIVLLAISSSTFFTSCKDDDKAPIKNQHCRITFWQDQEVTTEFTYDKDGNVLTKTENGKVTTYEYDEENKIIASSNDSMTYTYNYENNLLTHKEEILVATKDVVRKKLFQYSDGKLSRIVHYILVDDKEGKRFVEHVIHNLSYDEKGNIKEYFKTEMNQSKGVMEESFRMRDIVYDDKPGPIAAKNKIPFQFSYAEREIMLPAFANNNPTSAKVSASGFTITSKLSYDYNESGFPTKMKGGLALRFRDLSMKYDCFDK
jgi:YD repeat-containing protein